MDSLSAIHELISANYLLVRHSYFRAMREPVQQLLLQGGQLPKKTKVDKTSLLVLQVAIKSMLPNVADDDEFNTEEREEPEAPQEQRVALIVIDDVMTKHGASCTLSTQSVIRQIRRAEADESVVAMLFWLDCPGGSVFGLRQLAMEVRKTTKPTVGLVSEVACSGAFWVAQQMDYLYSDIDAMCAIGSVGVIGIHFETSEMDKKAGIKYTVLTDKDSTEKSLGNTVEPLSAEAEKKLRAEMDEIKEQFVSDILTGPRGAKIRDEQLMRTAVVLNSSKALEQGWVDAQGTAQDAVDKCFELASATDTNQNEPSGNSTEGKPKNNLNLNAMAFDRLKAIFGGGKNVKVSFDNEAHAQQVEDALAGYEEQVNNLTAQLNEVKAQKDASLKAANERISELEAMDADEPTDSDLLEGFNPQGTGATGSFKLRRDV